MPESVYPLSVAEALQDGRVVSWAFSESVCSNMADIGIETIPEYRGKGLGYAAARHLIRRIIAENKRLVWGCHYMNSASAALAYKLGFVKYSEYCILSALYIIHSNISVYSKKACSKEQALKVPALKYFPRPSPAKYHRRE